MKFDVQTAKQARVPNVSIGQTDMTDMVCHVYPNPTSSLKRQSWRVNNSYRRPVHQISPLALNGLSPLQHLRLQDHFLIKIATQSICIHYIYIHVDMCIPSLYPRLYRLGPCRTCGWSAPPWDKPPLPDIWAYTTCVNAKIALIKKIIHIYLNIFF